MSHLGSRLELAAAAPLLLMSISKAQTLWLEACTAAGLTAVDGGVLSRKWWLMLVSHYNEPHRQYHTLHHLVELSELLVAARNADIGLEEHRFTILWAIFFHDAICEPDAKSDDEARCCELWHDFCRDVECASGTTLIDPRLLAAVDRCIVSSDSPTEVTEYNKDVATFCDMKLGILGASRDRYAEYTQQIRAEYRHCSQNEYCVRRSLFLRQLLANRPIFKTAAFQKLEDVSIRNVEWELLHMQTPEIGCESLYFADRTALLRFERDHGRRDRFALTSDALTHLLAFNTGLFVQGMRLRSDGSIVGTLFASARTTMPALESMLAAASSPSSQPRDVAKALKALANTEPFSAAFSRDTEVTGDHIFLHTLTVARPHRRRGFASRLLRHYLETLNTGDFKHVRWITTLVPEALVHLFERNDFVVVSTAVEQRDHITSNKPETPSKGSPASLGRSQSPTTDTPKSRESPHHDLNRTVGFETLTAMSSWVEMVHLVRHRGY